MARTNLVHIQITQNLVVLVWRFALESKEHHFSKQIRDNIQYVDVFSTLVVPVKREYKVVLGIHVGVTYSRIKKRNLF